jgi:hypothetical protein
MSVVLPLLKLNLKETEEYAMTVREKIKEMVSTGFTGVPLIVGTNLKELMDLVIIDLDEYVAGIAERPIEYENSSDWYSALKYHEWWECAIRSEVAKYLDERMPVCWYRVYYTPKLDVV